MIWIVGAGCYHPDMLTLAAIKVLKNADCVLYDHLVNKELLNYTSHCECIDVGKVGHGKAFQQEDIHELLVTKSKQYQNVVRLKGGDPYLYGRGAEEMVYCLQRNIDCQYIPGISSAIGGLGYGGLAVTQRQIASGLSIHTLHYQDGKDHIDYDLLVQDSNTHVFFMGANKVKELVENCLKHGMDPDRGISLASHLTYPDQKIVTATLATILHNDLHVYTSPLLIVIGDIVKNQPILNNCNHLECYGKKILLLNIDDYPWPDEMLLLEKGIFSYQRQVGRIVYQYDEDKDLQKYSYLVFVSKHAIEGFIHYLKEHHQDLRMLSNKKICCIGTKTAAYFERKGIVADIIKKNRKEMVKRLEGMDALWMQGYDSHRDSDVAYLNVYKIESKAFEIEDTYDAIGVSCPFELMALETKHIHKETPLFCFAHKSYDKAKELGYKNIICCDSRKEAIIHAMLAYFQRKDV